MKIQCRTSEVARALFVMNSLDLESVHRRVPPALARAQGSRTAARRYPAAEPARATYRGPPSARPAASRRRLSWTSWRPRPRAPASERRGRTIVHVVRPHRRRPPAHPPASRAPRRQLRYPRVRTRGKNCAASCPDPCPQEAPVRRRAGCRERYPAGVRGAWLGLCTIML